MQLLIKDARGKTLASLDRITSYAVVARDMLSTEATLPLSVWCRDPVTGASSYDGARTQALSQSIVSARKERMRCEQPSW